MIYESLLLFIPFLKGDTMPQKLIDRIASASFVYGLIGAAAFSAASGNPMSGNVAVMSGLATLIPMIAVEAWARS